MKEARPGMMVARVDEKAALGGARITDGIGQCVEMVQQDKGKSRGTTREVQKAEEKEFPEDLLEECALACSNSHGPSDSSQPHRKTKIIFEEDQVDSALVVDSELSHDEGEEALNILPEIEKEQEEEEDQDSPCPRLSPELPEVEEQDVPQDSLDEVYLTPSLPHDLSDCQQPYSSTLCSLEDQLACSALDVACEYSSLKVTKLHCSPRQPLYILFPVTCAGEMDHLCNQAL
ncbi:hypothetical protein H8959_017764 [Pygathrix nigripes]